MISHGGTDDTVEMYLSRAIAAGVVGALLWVITTLAGYAVVEFYVTGTPKLTDIRVLRGTALDIFETMKLPLLVLSSGLVCGAVGFGMGFGSLLMVPYFRASSRKREINMLMADLVSFMYALSIGGLNQLEIFEAMARADDIYGEVSKEFESIYLETEYFDTHTTTTMSDNVTLSLPTTLEKEEWNRTITGAGQVNDWSYSNGPSGVNRVNIKLKNGTPININRVTAGSPPPEGEIGIPPYLQNKTPTSMNASLNSTTNRTVRTVNIFGSAYEDVEVNATTTGAGI